MPVAASSRRTGMSVDWSGMTSSPTTPTKMAFLPGKFIHAKA